MAAITVEIKNLDKLKRTIERFPAIAEGHIGLAIAKSLAAIQFQTFPRTPVKTGRLLADLRVPRFAPFQGSIRSDLPYARFVHDKLHEGTRYKNPSMNKQAVAGFLAVGTKRATEKIQGIFLAAARKITEDVARLRS